MQSHASKRAHPSSPDSDVLLLEIGREAGGLKISLSTREKGQVDTVRQVEEVGVSLDRINNRCQRIIETLNAANRNGRLTSALLATLKDTGQLFRDELFSVNIKQQLNVSRARHIILSLDDHLVHIPWELLNDGDMFLSQRFAVGRVVRTRHPVAANRQRILRSPLKFLVLADPAGDLKSAYEEGIYLRDIAEHLKDKLQVTFRSGNVNPDFIRAKLRDFDLVHFAGHADYDSHRPDLSGWRLGSERLTASQVIKMAGTGAMPSLVFANACQSARSETPGIRNDLLQQLYGLANAFILSGVKHYLGTFWEIPDQSSQSFAAAFYQHLLAGNSVGRALQKARKTLIDASGEDNIVWASYLLYGDPTIAYLQDGRQSNTLDAETDDPQTITGTHVVAELRSPEEVIHFDSSEPEKSKKTIWGWGVLLLLVLILGWVWLNSYRSTEIHQYEQRVQAAFSAGDYKRVADLCRTLKDRQPQRILSHLMLGNVNFSQGKLESASRYFQDAIDSRYGTDNEKAEAFIGLGRIASVNGQVDKALTFYEQAARLAPSNERPYLAQAMVLEQQGKLEAVNALLQKAGRLSNDPGSVAALTSHVQARAAFMVDQKRLERIDRLIEELSGLAQRPDRANAAITTRQDTLSIWMMDMASVGYHLQEGRAVMLTSACVGLLLEDQRVSVVERALMDKLLEELKLGSGPMAEPSALLSLGRLVAARLIVFGRLVNDGGRTHASMRCVDVETGEIKAVVNQEFTATAPIADMALKLTHALMEKLQSVYSLPSLGN
jgi:CHAT domain-containing protein/cytochrome c-type biogenesis protein CcmH/NrfG